MNSTLRLRARWAGLALSALSALPLACAAEQPAPSDAPAAATVRQTLARAEDLPRRFVKLQRLPSAYFTGELQALAPIARELQQALREDLAAYDIQDPATKSQMLQSLAMVAILHGDTQEVQRLMAESRRLQMKAAARATTGVLLEILAQARQARWSAGQVQAEVQQRFGAMAWAEVREQVTQLKGEIELFNAELVLGAMRNQLDPLARNADLVLPMNAAASLLGARVQTELLGAYKGGVLGGLTALLASNAGAAQVEDKWSQRTFALTASDPGTPVVVGIWDSGVDMSLFKAAPGEGIAFDAQGHPTTGILRPLGAAQARVQQLGAMVKGVMDLRVGVDSDEAGQVRQRLAALKADEAKDFTEDLQLAALYMHGTHVAGIATDGNPYARVYAATFHWPASSVPPLPTLASAQRTAAAYQAVVQAFVKAGARVVNMSWRYGASAYEQMLTFHNAGGSPEERKALAQRIFQIEKQALEAAIRSAPQVLFLAGAGNEDNNADFEQYIPAGLELPNLLTVGAVDKAGRETSFSSFGKTVVVHANGYEVESFLPGGARAQFSGTSMASPQVANLAAKLLALYPALSAEQLRRIVIDGAEAVRAPDGSGRVNFVHPKRSLEMARRISQAAQP